MNGSNKEILLCDADDTIENLLECWVRKLNRRFGTKVRKEDVTDWDIPLFFPELTNEQVYNPLYEKEFWTELSDLPDCFDVLKELNEKYDLHIATATNYQTCDTKIERILQLYPFLKWKQFIIVSNKQLLRGKYLIDDGVHNLIGGEYKGILFTQPHNKDFNAEAAGLIRVHGWQDIGRILL